MADLRGRAGLTQKQLAQKSGVTERSISSFENGDTWPRAATRSKLEDALGLPSGYLSNLSQEGPEEADYLSQFIPDGSGGTFRDLFAAMSSDLDASDPNSTRVLADRFRGVSELFGALEEYRGTEQFTQDTEQGVTRRFTLKFDDDGKPVMEVQLEKEEGDGDAEATPLTRAGVSPAPEDDGLGSFGGRARGDLDHESVNDGAGENVHPLRPDLDNMAAYRTGKETEKQRLLREEAERENESQDPDDLE